MLGEHRLMGFFWEKEGAKPYPFTGWLYLKNDGEFEGRTTDEFGGATISGEIRIHSLVFKKKYTSGSAEGGTPVHYTLTPMEEDPLAGGGWRGQGVVQGVKGDEVIWQAACMILPSE